MSQYTINHGSNCLNTINSNNNVWNNCTVADDRPQLLSWLSSMDPGSRHGDIQERRVNDVGEWLMETEEFRSWCGLGRENESDKRVLFCYGNPGVGKTFINSLIVDRLCNQTKRQNTVVTCFYFDFAARKEQTATSVLGSVLKQVISGMEGVPEKVSLALQEQRKAINGRKLQLDDIVEMLQLVTSSQSTYICIDALDECTAAQQFKLLDSLKKILEKSPSCRIFVTGRPHIKAGTEKRLAGRIMSVSVGPTRDDIVNYLRARLSEDETPDAMDEILEAEILEKIPENISEMFLLVSLNMDAILQEPTIYQRRQRLSKITDGLGLGDVYGATIKRIEEQGGSKSILGMKALMWISHAERLLSADELCHALGVELGSTDLNGGKVPSIMTLVVCCQGLIVVDKGGFAVRLIHFTLQEYLSAHPDIFRKPHSTMAEICLTYLNSEDAKAHSANPSPDIPNAHLLEYCSLYWGVHAQRELSDDAMALALVLLQEYDGHISAKLLLEQVGDACIWHLRTNFRFSGLHCASFFGVNEVVVALIEMQCCGINERDFGGYTPLAWAARNGHSEVVRILLELEVVNPHGSNDYGKTPLSYAAQNGHKGVVEILLRREEMNPDEPDIDGLTPLSRAACNGHEEVVKILLGQENVSPDKRSNDSRTPLIYASWNGHERVVRALLRRGEVNPEKSDSLGQTPLSYASWAGHEEVVKILLGQGQVRPDKPNIVGRTPLSFAAWCGHEGVAEILLGREEVNPDKPDDYGLTPLSHAAQTGNLGVAKILLGREEVNPDKPDNMSRTPLSRAAESGHEGVVTILLGREEVSPDKPDDYGKTPLSHAAQNGKAEVVEILLGREGVDPDKPDHHGNTPLSHAASEGHEDVVKILLEREGVNPWKLDNAGQTPLLHAASNGHEGVAQVFLSRVLDYL